jgi:hypothetical protein
LGGSAVKTINFFFYSAIHKLLTPFAQEIHRLAGRAAPADEICGSVAAALRFHATRFDQSNGNGGRIPIIPAGEVSQKNGRRTAARASGKR